MFGTDDPDLRLGACRPGLNDAACPVVRQEQAAQYFQPGSQQREPGPGQSRAFAERRQPTSPLSVIIGIPKPLPVKLETLKGHEVTFFISAETKTPGMTVEFLVRQFPSAGKLIALISNPDNRSSAKVTYYADPDSGCHDGFVHLCGSIPGR